MKRVFAVFLATIGLTASLAQANLLVNGDFNDPTPDTNNTATGWTSWSYGGGWANHEIGAPAYSYDGSMKISAGAASGSAGGGVFQTVSGTAGLSYTLTVLSGADTWWLPYAEMRMFFLDAGNNQLGPTAVQPTVDPAVYGQNYDIPHPWAPYSLTATAPAGTTQIKVEFTEPSGTGSAWFENADLSVVPEPGTLGLVVSGLAFLGYGFGRRARRS